MSDAGCDPMENGYDFKNVERMYRDRIKALEAEVALLREKLRGLLHHEIAHVGPGSHEAVMDARAALRKEE